MRMTTQFFQPKCYPPPPPPIKNVSLHVKTMTGRVLFQTQILVGWSSLFHCCCDRHPGEPYSNCGDGKEESEQNISSANDQSFMLGSGLSGNFKI